MKINSNLLFCISTLGLHLLGCNAPEVAPSVTIAGETIAVSVAPVARGMYHTEVSATGLLSTEFEARYGFLVGGVIDRIYVHEGDSFKQGQLLALLKTDEIDAGVHQANYALEKAQRDYHRVASLYADSVATREQMENVKTALDVAQKQLDATVFNRQYASIIASCDGFVSRKLASEGEVISAGAPVLVINENSPSSGWTLKLGLSDRNWSLINVGDPATVCIPAFPEKEFAARVYKKSQAAEPMTGIFQVELKLDINGSNPAVGMYAKAVIATSDSSEIARIPYEALVEANGNQGFVFVPAQHENKVEKLPVRIADFNQEVVSISGGLENVDEVITANSAFLNASSNIRIIK